jgi:flagellar biosynthesis protein FlhF
MMRLKFLESDMETEGGGRPAIDPADLVEAVLRYHDAPADLVRQVLACRRDRNDPALMLGSGLERALAFARLPDPARCRLMLIGPPAAGKTTMTAKLAARGGAAAARVFSTDGARPGGMAQLAEPMRVLGIDAEGLDIAAEILLPTGTAAGALLVDTGGTDAGSGFEALGRLARTLGVEPILVLPATIDPGEACQFARAARAIGVSRLLITRLDITRRLGGPLAAAAAGLAIAGGSVTPHFAYGLKPLEAGALAGRLIALARRRPPGEGSSPGPDGQPRR